MFCMLFHSPLLLIASFVGNDLSAIHLILVKKSIIYSFSQFLRLGPNINYNLANMKKNLKTLRFRLNNPGKMLVIDTRLSGQ